MCTAQRNGLLGGPRQMVRDYASKVGPLRFCSCPTPLDHGSHWPPAARSHIALEAQAKGFTSGLILHSVQHRASRNGVSPPRVRLRATASSATSLKNFDTKSRPSFTQRIRRRLNTARFRMLRQNSERFTSDLRQLGSRINSLPPGDISAAVSRVSPTRHPMTALHGRTCLAI